VTTYHAYTANNGHMWVLFEIPSAKGPWIHLVAQHCGTHERIIHDIDVGVSDADRMQAVEDLLRMVNGWELKQ
jgi:hypothetical protein